MNVLQVISHVTSELSSGVLIHQLVSLSPHAVISGQIVKMGLMRMRGIAPLHLSQVALKDSGSVQMDSVSVRLCYVTDSLIARTALMSSAAVSHLIFCYSLCVIHIIVLLSPPDY